MAKLVILFVFVLAIAGVIFIFGWIQIQLPPNTHALLFTKTGGWDEAVIEPGSFVWRWERLLPTNMKIYKYELVPFATEVALTGELPSASVYAEGLNPRPDFSYSITYSISFSLRKESLPKLASEQNLLPENYNEWAATKAREIAERASSYITDISQTEDLPNQAVALASFLESRIRRQIQTGFSDLEIHSAAPMKVRLPDMQLYSFAKERFVALAREQYEAERDVIRESLAVQNKADQWFGMLDRYGETLSRYPALLELFALDSDKLQSLLVGDLASSPFETSNSDFAP